MRPSLKQVRTQAFTLAELLIVLAILGVIATFTIPKILQAQQDGRNKAIAKEAAGAVATAFVKLQASGGLNPNTSGINSLTPYLNYVARDTSSLVDDVQTATTKDCSSWPVCIKLHNGAMLYESGETFAGTSSTNAVWFAVDPDGKVTDGTTNGPGKAVAFWLYYNGKLTDDSGMINGTVSSGSGPYSPCLACIPPWFNWN